MFNDKYDGISEGNYNYNSLQAWQILFAVLDGVLDKDIYGYHFLTNKEFIAAPKR